MVTTIRHDSAAPRIESVVRCSAFAVLGVLAGCLAPHAAGPQAPAQSHARSSWQPMLTLAGARVAIPDRTGMPLPQGPAPYTRLVSPVAAAAGGPDYYVADAGASRVYRYDPALDLMSVVGAVPARVDTRLFVGPDLSLFVVEPAARRVARYTRDGRLATAYADRLHLARPVSAAWDEAGGRLIVADSVYRHLVAFHPAGAASYLVPMHADDRHSVRAISAVAVGKSAIHVADPVCRCVLAVARDGRIAYSYGDNVIVQPGALALDDRERAYVADTGAAMVRVYEGVREIASVAAASLGIAQVTDIAIHRNTLVVADATTARVVIVRVPASFREKP